MRLFPRVVMLVACLPLLLPPGACACGASEAAAPKRATADAAKESHAPKRCGCRTHAHARSEAPATKVASPAPTEPEHPAHHAPGCPATPGAERAKFTERAAPVDHLTAVAFVALCADLPALASVPRAECAGTRSTAPHEAPPRYLKHCALLF